MCVCNVYVHVHLLSGIRATQTTSVKQLHAGSAYILVWCTMLQAVKLCAAAYG